MSTRLERVGQKAEAEKRLCFTNLFSLLKVELLRESFYDLRRNASPGVDGITWSQYEVNLDANLQDLEDRLHQGRYRAKRSAGRTLPSRPGGNARSE